jgi:hypothetical protein
MNSEEAKDILQLCRPDHFEDLNDPLVKEALETLEQDSELCAWFEEQQMVDVAICAELGRIMPSPQLKTSILSGMQERVVKLDGNSENMPKEKGRSHKTTESTAASNSSKILWFRPWVGIAAAFLFASVLLVLSRKESTLQVANKSLPASESVSDSAVNVAGIPDIIQFLGQQIADFNGSKFDKRSEQINELQSYLALSGMPNPTEIPQHLEAAPTIGCVTFDYDGTQMSMICFKNGQVYHLITVNKADLGKSRLSDDAHSKVQIFEHQKQAFKVWSEGDQIYILSTEGTKENIPEFI